MPLRIIAGRGDSVTGCKPDVPTHDLCSADLAYDVLISHLGIEFCPGTCEAVHYFSKCWNGFCCRLLVLSVATSPRSNSGKEGTVTLNGSQCGVVFTPNSPIPRPGESHLDELHRREGTLQPLVHQVDTASACRKLSRHRKRHRSHTDALGFGDDPQQPAHRLVMRSHQIQQQCPDSLSRRQGHGWKNQIGFRRKNQRSLTGKKTMSLRSCLDRREFLSAAAALSAVGRAPAFPSGTRPTCTLGLIADPHHGLAPDAQTRLDSFMAAVDKRKPDLLLQLGDFCHPPRAVKEAAAFLRTFEQFRGPRYHVLGNHDLDMARSKREILDAWGAERGFYSFDQGGFHFVVLDCNFVKNRNGSVADWSRDRPYEGRISPDQIAWLKDDLNKTNDPTVVISHQGFAPKVNGGVVPNGDEVRAVIAAANRRKGGGRVVLCMHGHNHLDGACVLDGVHYLQLNSASYLWVGEQYGRMAPYADPLFAFLELDPSGTIRLIGKGSTFSKPTPADRGLPNADAFFASIASREFRFTPRAG